MENSCSRINAKVIFFSQITIVLIFVFILPISLFSENKFNSEEDCLNSAKFFYLTGENKKAYWKLNSLVDKSWVDYLYLGLINEELGQIDLAIEAYKKALNLEKNSIGLFRLAKIYRAQKKYNKAAAFFKKLINYDSSIRVAYYYLGQCLRKINKNDEAYRYLAKAFNFYPDRAKVKDELIAVKKRLGDDFFVKRRKLETERRQKIKLSPYQRQEDIPYVRIGVAVGLDKFSFLSPAEFKIKNKDLVYQGKANVFYSIELNDNKIILSNSKTEKIHEIFLLPVEIISEPINGKNYPFYILNVVYGAGDFWHKRIDRAYRGDFKLIFNNNKINLVNIVSIEEYLYGVLAAEIPANTDKEALKAQAVLARSLAIRNKARHVGQGFDFCADSHCQVYHGLSAETESTKDAVDQTKGIVIFYKGKVPEIFYHSNCGGCLSSDIFGKKEYLAKGLDSEKKKMLQPEHKREEWFWEYPETFCSAKSSKFRWQRIYDNEDFKIAFGTNINKIIDIVSKDKKECFRHSKMDVVFEDKSISLESGLAIRKFFDRLRSSAFLVELKKNETGQTDMLIFWGSGFGHGTGLCQEGAIGMAREGYGYRQILNHYYPKGKLGKGY
ncbi:MAG: SpoIID/LytB domain-containing protein [Candidatus Omnitrophica bacterium]|nr:SpoIID/LytB domain-containing protein [Candidatus Omnitrophota bacterium]MCF7888180.1 SpoIID/LytB domain-containing protein [Candidatus Omnitrophota bacterium]